MFVAAIASPPEPEGPPPDHLLPPWRRPTGALSSTGPATAEGLGDPERPELQKLHELLRFPRSGPRGRKQKQAFIRQGVELGHFSATYPHLPSGLTAFNFCAQSRVVIVEEVFNRFRREHQERVAAAKAKPEPKPAPEQVESSCQEESVLAETEVVSVTLHRSLHFLTLQPSGRFERGDGSVGLFDITDRSRVRILFIDQHQVLDRDKEQYCYNHGIISAVNLEAVSRFQKYAEDHNIQLYTFILSYVGSTDRYHSCKTIWNNSTGLHPLISGIIVTFEPLGREGKAACIEAFTSHFEHKCACLIDDNADILEEVSQNPKALGVHIKLSKKRRLRSDVNFDWGTWLSDDWVFAAVSKFLDGA